MKRTHVNADMSHQNGLAYKLELFVNSLRENGLFSTLRKITKRVNYRVKGIDFSTQNIYDLTRTGEYQEHGTALVSTSVDFLSKLLTDLEDTIGAKLNRELFVDYGSGKGAAIIHAKVLGFKRAVGVEFAKELHEIAERNIQKLNLKDVTSIYADATSYQLPNDVSVIYFFNPFDEVVMKKVVENIVAQKESFEGEVYVMYGNASCDVLNNYFTFLKHITYPSSATVDFFKV